LGCENRCSVVPGEGVGDSGAVKGVVRAARGEGVLGRVGGSEAILAQSGGSAGRVGGFRPVWGPDLGGWAGRMRCWARLWGVAGGCGGTFKPRALPGRDRPRHGGNNWGRMPPDVVCAAGKRADRCRGASQGRPSGRPWRVPGCTGSARAGGTVGPAAESRAGGCGSVSVRVRVFSVRFGWGEGRRSCYRAGSWKWGSEKMESRRLVCWAWWGGGMRCWNPLESCSVGWVCLKLKALGYGGDAPADRSGRVAIGAARDAAVEIGSPCRSARPASGSPCRSARPASGSPCSSLRQSVELLCPVRGLFSLDFLATHVLSSCFALVLVFLFSTAPLRFDVASDATSTRLRTGRAP